jgi:hypothetical protein
MDGTGWSIALRESLLLWPALEAAHVMTLMLFVGTIVFVDLRLLGLTFTNTPISAVDKKILPLTMIGFVILVITGIVLFYAKPLTYYNNVYFRVKLLLIAAAMINILVFHFRVQKNQQAWDDAPKPPASVRIIAGISLSCWILVVVCGRLIAYGDWLHCHKLEEGSLMYSFASCPAVQGEY